MKTISKKNSEIVWMRCFLLGHETTSVSVQRKELLKPVLRNEYATLCDGNIPATSLLFGDDLAKSLKEARQVRNVGRNFQPKNGKRFWNRPRKEFGWRKIVQTTM